jgi:excinuclease ABC subunit A
MRSETITVKGAREHNLKNVSIALPRGKLICFTGVSGSGKSSFAFDTLYAEGQRRYLESLSSYARQFLGQLAKPDVDRITGLSPAIAIQQKTSGWNPRSTVGTITQIHDYLRVLFARVGRQHCPKCGKAIRAQSREQIIARIMELPEGTRFMVLAPVIRGQKGEHQDLFEDMLRQGYARARVDGQIVSLNNPPKLSKNLRHDIEIVVDRLIFSANVRARLAEAVENALNLGKGTMIVQPLKEGTEARRHEGTEGEATKPRSREATEAESKPGAQATGLRAGTKEQRKPPNRQITKSPNHPIDTRQSTIGNPLSREMLLSSHYACPDCGLSFEPPSPQLFSFNSPTGMCPACEGLGTTFDFDPELLVPDATKSILQMAVEPMRLHLRMGRWRRHIYEGVARHVGFDLRTPWKELPARARDALLNGLGDAHVTYEWRGRGGAVWRHGGTFAGVLAELREKHRQTQSPFIRAYYEQFMRSAVCPDCQGGRLNAQALAVQVGGRTIREISALSIREALGFFDALAAVARPSPESRAELSQRLRAGKNTGKMPVPHVGPEGAKDRSHGWSEAEPVEGGGKGTTRPGGAEEARGEPRDALVQPLTPTEHRIAADVIKEIRGRLRFLADVGLDYLSMDRTAPTLSGGESQRIRLASQIGAGLVGVLYVLDEPSVGLHARDQARLLDSLGRLRDLGNTVIVVEHDEQTMRAADHVVDFGPGPGIRGGKVVAQGSLSAVAGSKRSVTGKYLRGEEEIPVPVTRRPIRAATVRERSLETSKRQKVQIRRSIRCENPPKNKLPR